MGVLLKDFEWDKLCKDTSSVREALKTQKSYIISYHEFVKYFSDLKEVTKHHLIIGIHFVYGWMPTILELYPKSEETFDEAVIILNKAKNRSGLLLSVDDLNKLKELFNNSLVGTSKLLHFINPEQYAIWDSRVYRYLTGKEAHNKIGNPDLYLDYLSLCKEIAARKEYDEIHKEITNAVGYDVTKTRSIELIMFCSGKK